MMARPPAKWFVKPEPPPTGVGMDTITIADLEVAYSIGVTEAERASVQRLLLTIKMTHDGRAAAAVDDLAKTIDYFAVSQKVVRFGEGRSWKLIETLAQNLAAMILEDFGPASVTVEVKKFVIPEARYVAATVTRP